MILTTSLLALTLSMAATATEEPDCTMHCFCNLLDSKGNAFGDMCIFRNIIIANQNQADEIANGECSNGIEITYPAGLDNC